jgi:catechol 2,3-dioxygenase-like lactoylglutathione lyase family enzyme
MSVRLAYVNILARDTEALARFYADTFGFAEIEGHRSPIYRCLDAGGVELGFNAPEAYDLLNLASRKPDGRAHIATYITFECDSATELDGLCARAAANGARVLKAPYDTYYNARQCVIEDPEGNVFRVNHRMGPRKPAEAVENPPWGGKLRR